MKKRKITHKSAASKKELAEQAEALLIMTKFTNLVIAAYQREHQEVMEQAHGFSNTTNSGTFSYLSSEEGSKEPEE